MCRHYRPCEFLGFVWTDCWGDKSNYVITSPANCHFKYSFFFFFLSILFSLKVECPLYVVKILTIVTLSLDHIDLRSGKHPLFSCSFSFPLFNLWWCASVYFVLFCFGSFSHFLHFYPIFILSMYLFSIYFSVSVLSTTLSSPRSLKHIEVNNFPEFQAYV